MGALLPFVLVGEQTDRSRAQEIVGPDEASVGREKWFTKQFGRVRLPRPEVLQYGMHQKDGSS